MVLEKLYKLNFTERIVYLLYYIIPFASPGQAHKFFSGAGTNCGKKVKMPPISSEDGPQVTGDVIGEISVRQSGNIVRLDVPIPFFLKNDVFSNLAKPGYSWNMNSHDNSKMILLVGAVVKHTNADDNLLDDEARYIPNKKNVEEYSIGGCPLECPFDLNEDFDEALDIDSIPLVFEGLRIPSKYIPLQVDEGKRSIRKINCQTAPFASDLNLIKGSDPGNWFSNGTPVLLFVDGYSLGSGLTLTGFRNELKLINVHVMGRQRPDSPMLNLACFHSFHEQNLGVENRPIFSIAHAIYEKLHGEYPSRGKVYLEFLFKEPSSIFDIPPEDCLTKIAIKPLPGDANPCMEALWSEIQDLERWMDILKTIKCSPSGGSEVTSFLNSSIYDIGETKLTKNVQAVQELLVKEPVDDLHGASFNEYSDSLGLVLQRVVNQERTDSDFTDKLWSVVRKCESIEELQDCLHLVFQAVANKMYRPYLLLSNDTTMAKNLSLVMKGELGSLLKMRRHDVMVNVVIQCGLMKLFKDYNFVFCMSHILERGEIDSFNPSSSDNVDALWKMKQLHCIIEILCLSKERLSLTVNILEGHAKKMLKIFSSSGPKPFTWEETYHFDVPSNDIRRVMNGLHPIYYKVKMDSKTFLQWATTTVVISPERYITYKKNPNEDFNLRQYYVYVITESGRLEEED